MDVYVPQFGRGISSSVCGKGIDFMTLLGQGPQDFLNVKGTVLFPKKGNVGICAHVRRQLSFNFSIMIEDALGSIGGYDVGFLNDIAKHVLKDASMAIVGHFDRGINPA